MDEWLQPTPFLNFDHPRVKALAEKQTAGIRDMREKAIQLFYAVRDGIRYDPYHVHLTTEGMRASATLRDGFGWCVRKAVLLSALCRAIGIPARLGFADVQNHQASESIVKMLGNRVFYWHGYSLLYLNGKWVKATPAFDKALCDRNNIVPVEFDGKSDAVFHANDRKDRPHMEYLNDRGTYDDLPLEQIRRTYLKEYKAGILASGQEKKTASKQ
jgi:transglutaminase-like putative cysteine protease